MAWNKPDTKMNTNMNTNTGASVASGTEPTAATARIPVYRALGLQTRTIAVNQMTVEAARAQMLATTERMGRQIRAAKGFVGQDLKLVVLPEYCLTGFPMGESIPEWVAKGCLAPDGAEYTALATVAQQNGVWLAANNYETDAHFPGLYFQASTLFSPSGDCALRYRRLVSLYAPTPHDVWPVYLDHYGLEGVFPVADTPLGRMAAIASEEILYPEIARALALRGAEVLLHSTSEVGSPQLTPKDVAKRARAYENMAYVVSANSGGLEGCDIPAESTDGMSKVVDWEGRVLAEAGFGESMVAHAEIDMEALRRWRLRPGMSNILSRQRTELFAPVYGGRSVHAPGSLLDANGQLRIPTRAEFAQRQREAIAGLVTAGIYKAPAQ
jgi:predicted amidohydrolase